MGLMIEPRGYAESMLGKDYQRQDCSLARALEVVGERWTMLIVRDAFYGVRRFSDFQAHLDVPKAVLSDRLNGLVEDGILDRRPDPRHAGRHLYELTPAGRDLWPALHALLAWGDRHRHPNSRVFSHATCGTMLDASGVCSTCGQAPEPEGIVMEPRRGRSTLRDDPVTAALRAPHRLLEPVET
jgi:DNA-binding HxlR family transcriptional regulator